MANYAAFQIAGMSVENGDTSAAGILIGLLMWMFLLPEGFVDDAAGGGPGIVCPPCQEWGWDGFVFRCMGCEADCPGCAWCDSSIPQCKSLCLPSECKTCNICVNCKVCGNDPNKFCCSGTPSGHCCPTGTTCCNGSCCDPNNYEICKNDICVVAKPTNMRQTYVEDLGNGVLHFVYDWNSTTGDKADLYNCKVREKVDYPGGNPYYWPSPPWAGGYHVDNPTLLPNPPGPATAGHGEDYHSPGTLTPPYQPASFSATQVYQYCGPSGNWETLLSIGSIQRFVIDEGGGLWRYSIIKSGAYAEIFPLP